MPAFSSPHSSPYARLVANVIEHAECWLGTERTQGRGGYCQVNARIPGLGMRIKKFSAHILTWVAHETGATDWDDLFLYYHEFRCSGDVLDHTCNNRECRQPKHLEPVTQLVNIQRRDERRSPRCGAPLPEEVPF